MKNVLLATVATFALSSVAFAADVKGSVDVDFTQSADDKIVAAPTVELSFGTSVGVASIDLAEDNGTIVLDGYSVGTAVAGVSLSFGDQGDILGAFEGKTEAVGGTTLTNLDDAGESLIVGVGPAQVLVGLTDISTDVTDVAHVQGTIGTAFSGVGLAVGGDYNLDTEETTLLAAAAYNYNAFALGVTGTYQVDAETLGYEADVTYANVTAFVNGDKDDVLQNVGAGFYGDLNGMGIYAEGAYNLDTEEFTPAAGISFSF